jgi:hypothetical protein
MVKQSVVRNDIGVRNPYAIAELINKRKINWREKSSGDKIKILESTFGIPYGELFDSKYDSPLFRGLLKKEKRSGIQAVNVGSAMPSDCNRSVKTWDSNAGSAYEQNKPTYDDPIQGCVANCYLIAAFSSIAWATPYMLPQRLLPGPFKFKLPAPDPFNPGTDTVNGVNSKLALTDDKRIVFADSYTPNEIWPGIYEKAYGMWITKNTDNQPDITKTTNGNPVTALYNIMGYRDNWIKTYTTTIKQADGSLLSADDIWKGISGLCTSAKTFRPTVAWTYGVASTPPGDADYNNSGLVRDHAYSILGIHTENSKRYVVIRNPFGNGEPMDLSLVSGTSWGAPELVDQGFTKTGAADPKYPPTGLSISFKNPDGVFALDVNSFRIYFEAFGWIQAQ